MSNEKMLESMRSMHERMKQMGYQPSYRKPEEKNPKQILLDWVENVEESAKRVDKLLLDDCRTLAKEEVNNIIGQCKAMMTVLKNSD